MKDLKLTKTKKSRSLDQAKLKILCDLLCDDIENLLDYFSIEYKHTGRMITMCCPIHGGDNPSAVNLYPEGDNYRGNWKCRTHGCEKVFKSSIIGFIRGVLSHSEKNWENDKDDFVSFDYALDFASKFVKQDLKSIHISSSERNKKTFMSVINYIGKNNCKPKNLATRETAIKSLDIPAQYFIDRNYSKDILVKYDVGLCTNPSKPMYQRVVVPIYDNEYKYIVGSSGRSIFNKCEKCGAYHDPSKNCPSKTEAWKFSKWKHSADFQAQNTLYNFWFAKNSLLETSTAIIVESPGNVWRLEENGIHNSVAIFGASMSDRQKILLDGSGAMNLVILTDNDEAGRNAAEQIKSKCQNTYKIYIPTISKGDVGEMTNEEIDTEIKEFMEKIV